MSCLVATRVKAFCSMPYRVNIDLPSRVRSHLPEHAQDIYREAFNHAYAAHAGELDQERRAHMIAWAAVKRVYTKADDKWIPRWEAQTARRS
jgi:cation transport regulator